MSIDLETIRKHQQEFQSEDRQAECNDERGRYCIGPAWAMHADIDALIAELERLQADNAKLRQPNFYWDDRCLEYAVDSIAEAVDCDDAGDIIQLRPIHELPTVWVLVGDEPQVFDSKEAAEDAQQAKGNA